MRYLMTLVFCFPLLSSQAHACFIGTGETIFFEVPPNLQPEHDVIAIVSTLDKTRTNGGAIVTQTAKVIQVLQSSDARIKAGDTVVMKYENSSCISGANGRTGAVVAKTRADSKGNVVLHLYTTLNAPAMLPDGFTSRPRPLQVGEEIPQNSAVILIGLAGKTPVDSLLLDHSKKKYAMYADFPSRSNTIVAFVIPLGLKQLSLAGIGVRQFVDGKPSYTVTKEVLTQKIDIDRAGLYYTATLDTNNPGKFQDTPLPDQLKQFRADYANTVGRLEAINFKWPSQ